MSQEHHIQTFREEAEEHLDELQISLLQLEACPDDPDIVNQVFRLLHTLKGSGAMFGFDSLAALAHELEALFALVRDARLSASSDLIDLTLRGKDVIRALLFGDDHVELTGLLTSIRGFAERRDEEEPPPAPSPAPQTVFGVRFEPDPSILTTGTNPLLLLDELRELGACLVLAHGDAVPALENLDPEQCYLGWSVLVRTACGENAIRDVFIFVEHCSKLRIEALSELPPVGSVWHEVCGRLIALGLATSDEVDTFFPREPAPEHAAALDAGPPQHDAAPAQSSDEHLASSIRVPVARLDALVDLVGELVIAQARLMEMANDRDDLELLGVAEVVERLTNDLRDNTLSIRTLAIGTTYGRFRRLVRDLSVELDKPVRFVATGAETELDKTVIERMIDPLMHVLRNAIDHGIESREERLAAGKEPEGVVWLSAEHREASIVITVGDDGRGLDREAILALATTRGIVPAGAQLSDREVDQLIFAPGFSTAGSVSDVSGRGVGMDVAKRAIEALRGSVEVESARGVGTTISIKLPLTLAIIDGLSVSVGGRRYVFPLALVEECFEFSETRETHALAQVRDELIPFVRLREWFGVQGEAVEHEQLVVVRVDDRWFGFVVDWVIGQVQAVMKSLGQVYARVDGLSGATILGDGSVALIVDLSEIAKTVLSQCETSSDAKSAWASGPGVEDMGA